MNKHFKQILFTRKQIEEKILELANWVDETYKDSNDLILIGLLKGSVPFMAQLMKDVKTNHEMDFLTVSSYEGGAGSNGSPKIIMDLANNIEGKDILIIEDIVDTGRTLLAIKNLFLSRKPNSIRILTLLDKKEGRVVKMEVDKYGFSIPNVFVAGFGLDVNGKLRNLPYIGEFDTKYIDEY
ncbi:MAG: hypoxanthine phosphoribosyltransferase [Mycoplasmatales bacterium]|nr:hypoxanthine phosphoribosyltransferase [Mycoplasmatales bacterium]